MPVTSQVAPAATAVPLCVDLDGTLIHSDLLWESFVRVLRTRPWRLLLAPFWFLQGRARLKRELAAGTALDVATLPYNTALLAHLRAEKARGRKLLLVTASDHDFARPVAEHLGMFDDVLGSDGTHNLRGARKAAVLAERFGERGFDYAGNSSPDLAVWARSRAAVVVNAPPSLAARARAQQTVAAEFPGPDGTGFTAWRRLLRPHQWAKNLLVLVPLLTSHQLAQPATLTAGLLAFVAFCLSASGVYVLNDLLDLDADRRHATKRERPLAAGRIALSAALLVAPVLLLAGFGLALALTRGFAVVLTIYVATSCLYSWRFKQTPLLDVFVLAGLYTLRVIGGHAVTGIAYSDWLLAFAMFLFVSLALVKRFQELQAHGPEATGFVGGRGYRAEDLPLLTPLGVASGYLAALVLALYVNSEQVRLLYRQPTLLLLICPLLLYWISRVWLVAHRGKMHDDPVVFALKDKPSYAVGALALLVVRLAT